ncbi:MAG: protein kinase [Algicola sp.]|nr:protein kinase [Algicola sp.]
MDLHALQPGYMLGEYRIEKLIGEGGFGLTYLAHDTHLDKKVAIKEYMPGDFAWRENNTTILPKSTGSQQVYDWGLAGFMNEAKMLAKFDDSTIVRIHRCFKDNGTAYLVMEYCEGGCLSARYTAVEAQKAEQTVVLMREDKVRHIIGSLIKGLQQVHDGGVLHRDIKPNNIMFRKDNTPVLIDFGAARLALGAKSRSVTTIVTPGFAPLEQYSNNKNNLGPWTDIYSMAAVAYICLTGKRPCDATDRIIDDPQEVLGSRPDASAFLKSIDWALAVDRKKRPQNLAQWYAAWAQPDDNFVIPVPAPSIAHREYVDPATVLPQPQSKKRRFTISVVTIVVLALGLVAINIDFTKQVVDEPKGQSQPQKVNDSNQKKTKKTKARTPNSAATDSIIIHRVVANETVSGIADKYGLSEKNLKSANPGLNNQLSIGQKIKIVGLVSHEVADGDTVFNLSHKYGITQAKLITVNPGIENKMLKGRKLIIPNIRTSN